MKLTKRKGFNFFRSYYDVYNELSDEDKVAFMDALLDRQFLGVKPEGLNGMAKFAYISQTNSIDSQIKGYEDKTGVKLTPTEGGAYGGENTPTEQVQVQEEVQVQVQEKEEVKEKEQPNAALEKSARDFESESNFFDFWELHPKKVDKPQSEKTFLKLSKENQHKAIRAAEFLRLAYEKDPSKEKKYILSPYRFLRDKKFNEPDYLASKLPTEVIKQNNRENERREQRIRLGLDPK